MSSPDNQSTASLDTDFTKTWRYKIGLTMIIVGNVGILFALVLPALGVGATAVGAWVVGGEIVSLASIAFLGKEGFKAIKSKFFAFVKASYTGSVGPSRHYIGIALLATNVVIHYIVLLYLWDVFGASTAEGPPPVIGAARENETPSAGSVQSPGSAASPDGQAPACFRSRLENR